MQHNCPPFAMWESYLWSTLQTSSVMLSSRHALNQAPSFLRSPQALHLRFSGLSVVFRSWVYLSPFVAVAEQREAGQALYKTEKCLMSLRLSLVFPDQHSYLGKATGTSKADSACPRLLRPLNL